MQDSISELDNAPERTANPVKHVISLVGSSYDSDEDLENESEYITRERKRKRNDDEQIEVKIPEITKKPYTIKQIR